MKNILLLLCSLALIKTLYSQPNYEKILEMKYSDFPLKLRVENSGIYFLSSFDIEKDNIWLNAFDLPVSLCCRNNKIQNSLSTNGIMRDYVLAGSMYKALPGSTAQNYNTKYKKSFLHGSLDIFSDDGGNLANASSNSRIALSVKNRSELQISYEIPDFNKIFIINFPSNLAYSELLGIDSKGNSFILAETYVSECPLKVKREVFTISNEGKVLSVLEIPSIKYFYCIRDFQIDAEGNLYHMISEKDKITIYRWTGLTLITPGKITYPSEFNYELHYNEIVCSAENNENQLNSGSGKEYQITAVNRANALRTGESYVLCKYSCKANNLAPNNTTAPDGDIVRTPVWLIAGMNARVPYKWGGFNTLTEFLSGLQSGKYAGDINTAGVSSYAVGVDCSGFVSRCWQLSYHSSTSNMPRITTQYTSWDELKPGDAIHKQGHVRMFIDRTSGGAFRTVEASARDWAVSYWTYTPSELAEYSPRYYNGMVNDFSANQPMMQSAVILPGGNARISWTCDTSNVKGYRLYKSTDVNIWSLVQDESVLKQNNATIAMKSSAEYYRVSSVLNNSPSFSESNWSGVLGLGIYPGNNKVLIVDSFERETGSWRASGNTFSFRYGKAMEALKLNFETVKNTQVINSAINLNNYKAVYWMLGDESTVNESFSTAEQTLIKNYLEGGGKLFVSGSEIGWDLFYKGNADDKSFYNNYLKAVYISDDASGSVAASGAEATALGGTALNFAQTYQVPTPDVIDTAGGSKICMKYSNGKGAGIEYTGRFGTSLNNAKLIYLAFPLESTANDTAFNSVVTKANYYFFPEITSVTKGNSEIQSFSLSQNYPNPFNPETKISYSVKNQAKVIIKVYDILGNEKSTVLNEVKNPGSYSVSYNASGLPSGVYIYSIQAGEYSQSRKMLLLK